MKIVSSSVRPKTGNDKMDSNLDKNHFLSKLVNWSKISFIKLSENPGLVRELCIECIKLWVGLLLLLFVPQVVNAIGIPESFCLSLQKELQRDEILLGLMLGDTN